MSERQDSKDFAEILLDLIMKMRSKGGGPRLLPAQDFFFYDTVTEMSGQVVKLAKGGDAKMLNGGSASLGDTVMVLRTESGSLYVYYPYVGGRPKKSEERKKLFEHLRNVYFVFYIDSSGSMDSEISAVTSLYNILREEIGKILYTSEELLDKYFPPPIHKSDERFLRWLGEHPPTLEERELEAGYEIIQVVWINESDSIYHEWRDYVLEPSERIYKAFFSTYAAQVTFRLTGIPEVKWDPFDFSIASSPMPGWWDPPFYVDGSLLSEIEYLLNEPLPIVKYKDNSGARSYINALRPVWNAFKAAAEAFDTDQREAIIQESAQSWIASFGSIPVKVVDNTYYAPYFPGLQAPAGVPEEPDFPIPSLLSPTSFIHGGGTEAVSIPDKIHQLELSAPHIGFLAEVVRLHKAYLPPVGSWEWRNAAHPWAIRLNHMLGSWRNYSIGGHVSFSQYFIGTTNLTSHDWLVANGYSYEWGKVIYPEGTDFYYFDVRTETNTYLYLQETNILEDLEVLRSVSGRSRSYQLLFNNLYNARDSEGFTEFLGLLRGTPYNVSMAELDIRSQQLNQTPEYYKDILMGKLASWE